MISGALFGLSLGSFLNVVVYRTPRHLSVVRPGSFCPRCNHEITAFDNVPLLSWLVLRGRCRRCRNPISVRYPLVETGTAAGFAAIAATVRPLSGVPGFWAMSATIAVVSIVELDRETCPPSVPAIGTCIGIVAFMVGAAVVGHLGFLEESAFGLLAAGLSAVVLWTAPRAREGSGDAALLTFPAFGACVGWLGVVPALIGTATAVVGVCALVMASAPVPAAARSGSTDGDSFAKAHWAVRSSRSPVAPLAVSLAAGTIAALMAAGLGA